MKIAMVGYGRMGKTIETLAAEYGGEVVLRLDEFNNAGQAMMTAEHFAGIDVAIEFTTPQTAVPNILKLQELGVPTVVGQPAVEDRRPLAWVRRQIVGSRAHASVAAKVPAVR